MQDLKARSKKIAIDVIIFCRTLPSGDEFQIIRRQLIRAATGTASNYRAAQQAKSKPDFISNLGDAEEEADEALLWLECLVELATSENPELKRLLNEANELVAILTSSRKTARN